MLNLGGNKYRLVTRLDDACRIVCSRFVHTRAAYDRIDAETIR